MSLPAPTNTPRLVAAANSYPPPTTGRRKVEPTALLAHIRAVQQGELGRRAIVSYAAIVVRPDSQVYTAQQLANRTVGVLESTQMATVRVALPVPSPPQPSAEQ